MAVQSAVAVLDPDTMEAVAADCRQVGEIMFRGNICMKRMHSSKAIDV